MYSHRFRTLFFSKMDSLSTLCRSASILQLETVDDVCFVKSWIAKNQQEEITSAQNDKLTVS